MNKDIESVQTGSHLPVCVCCSRELVPDEIGLTRKIINRGAEKFYCLSCLASRLDVPEEALQEKIVQFRRIGCTLFQ